ncbi:TetR family transcriptional regulator [Skermania piniformis]
MLPRDRRVPTRSLLLEAGRRVLASSDEGLLLSGLTVDQVAESAGLSGQTFHTAFSTRSGAGVVGGKAAFIAELLDTLLDHRDPKLRARVEDVVAAQSAAAIGDPRQLVRDICRWDYERVRDEEDTQLRIVACAVARDNKRAVRSVKASYSDLLRIAHETTEGMLRSWGASLRQPFTLDKLAVVMTALVEGLVLRSRFDPEAVSPELFGDAVLALFASIMDVEQTHEHIDDVVAPLATAAMSEYAQRERDLPDDPEQAIVDAARIEFGQRGYYSTQRAHIAATAGVDLDLLRALYPSKVDIVAAGLEPMFEPLRRRVTSDIKVRRKPKQIIERYGLRLAELIVADPTFIEAMALVMSVQRSQGQVDSTLLREAMFFPGLIVETIEAGQASGAITSDVAAVEIAAAYTNNIIFRCLSRREESGEEVMAIVNRLVLHGVITHDSTA